MTISQAASVNLWREAILDRLAALCMDAPQDEPPASILRRIIAAEVEIALDPSVSDAVPRRTLLQMALDALDRAISDDRAYIRECKDAAEAIRAHLAAQPAPVPLTDDLIDSVIRDVAELDYSSPEGMPDVMLVTADELRGILQAHGITGGKP